MKKFTSSIAGASVFISVMAILSRSVGFLREVVFAGYFGLKKEFDVYLVGAVIPIIINSSIIYIAQNYFIPAWHQIPDKEKKREKFFNETLWRFVAGSIFISGLLFLFGKMIIDFFLWSSSYDTKLLARNIFSIFLLSIPPHAAYSVFLARLQSNSKFKHPAISQVLLNFAVIFIVLVLHNKWNIYTVPVGYALGSFIQLAYIYFFETHELEIKHLFQVLKTKSFFKVDYKIVFIIIIEIIGQLYILIDRYFYNYVQPGGIAAINYASILFLMPIAVFSFSLSIVMFPKFSESYGKKDFEIVSRDLNSSIRYISFLFIPITFIYLLDGEFVTQLVFQRGEFNKSDTMITAQVLKVYSFSLVFFAIYSVLNKLLYSMNLIKHLLLISLVLLLMKIFINFNVVKAYGYLGLALSSSIAYFLFFAFGMYLIYSRIKLSDKNYFIKDLFLFTAITSICYFLSDYLISVLHTKWLLTNLIKLLLFSLTYLLSVYILIPDIFSDVIWKRNKSSCIDF